ncbi:Z1 domain-containing protein [Crocinitomicaceae bacterium]|nr:Z1 domain-containing protein [Crocinitomicaceae bacterium]
MTTFDINKFRDTQPKQSRYEYQLRRIQRSYSTKCIETAVEGAVKNMNDKAKSFVIYGEPQSGKTEMMICLTAKLLDEGHKIIIILLNDNVELLNQNFQRFSLSGINPTPKKYDQILDPSIKIGERRWVIFCKKNTHNLKDLIDKIGKKKEKIIIDDEADYATPDGNINKDEKEASAINRYVGQLLDENATYIGVTATPARLDLNDTYKNESENWVHFPAHDMYTGQDHFFPIDQEQRVFDLFRLPKENDSPKYLRTAFFRFLVNVAHLNTIDDGYERNFSMLVHTSGKIVEHDADYKNIAKIMENLGNHDSTKFESYCHEIWKIALSKHPTEADSLTKYILENTGKISPIVMNNKSNDDYEAAINPATPFTVVIGGNIVSRGVTFNNLLSMFFTRDVKHKIQQDTYIQRARMFGSRGNVLSNFELHIPGHLYDDWHRCFLFHRLSWDAIKNGEVPVWLSDRRVKPAAGNSIKKSIVSINNGEIACELFNFNDKLQEVWKSDLEPLAKLQNLNTIIPELIPDYLMSFIENYGSTNDAICIHNATNISKQKGTNVDDIIRKRGLFGGAEIKKNNHYNHHFRIFYNDTFSARVVYKNIGNISFLKTNK